MKKLLKKIIPAKYHYRLAEIARRILGKKRRSSYSQFGEDMLIAKLIPRQKGTYVDVGAHHPERYSNTLLLYTRGWHGVNIDPNPDTIKLFNKARPGDANLCLGVAAQEGELEYYRFSDPAVNTFNAEEAEKWKKKNWLSYLGATAVEVKPLRIILNEVGIGEIDLLSVDAEGMDLEVLESNDWGRYSPRVVCVEGGEFEEAHPEQNKIFMYLRGKGYALRGVAGLSLIFDRA